MLEWLFAVGLASCLIVVVYRRGRREPDLPPGPPTSFLTGNIPIMTTNFLQYTTWARQYGEIYSLKAGPTGTMVVLTSPNAIYEVMEKHGATTLDRPQQVVFDHITGGLMIGISRYNAYWRSSRKAAYEVLKPSSCVQHLPIQAAEATQLLFDMMTSSEGTFDHIRRFAFSAMLSVIYGQRTPQFSHPTVEKNFQINRRIGDIMIASATPPLELFPFLKYVPERWASWKTTCKEIRHDQRELFFGLLGEMEERVRRGEENGCYIERVLGLGKDLKLNREEIGYFGTSMMAGGVVTTAAWLHFFVLCMTAYPHVRRRAQAEIDRVVGSERLPELQDWESLPYLQAISKEISRFRPLVPVVFPHVSTSEVLYKNYRIPAGTALLANSWGVFHDESLYENPGEFNPDRFIQSPLGLRKEARFEHEEAFKRLTILPWGCGRRSCPGIHLANQSLAINCMNLIWAFDFEKARDSRGKEVDVDLWAFSQHSNTIDPYPFTINPKPRSTAHADIIQRSFVECSHVFEQFERELSEEDRKHVAETRTMVT